MFRIIGVISALSVFGFGAMHYTGHLKLSGDAEITEKGAKVYDAGLEETRVLTSKGLDGAKSLTNRGFDALRRGNKNGK